MAADFLWQLDALSLAPARLHEVSLTIPRGATAVIGWSGAGKTSLLDLLAGFAQPDRGTIVGAPRVAWVPQDGGLWPHCTAREHLEIAGASREHAEELLTAFELRPRRAAHPHELSQGERSRLAVARALATPADVLVMDEPLVHVDLARASGFWKIIRAHCAAAKASLVFSTHVPETALGEAAHAICLRAGRVQHAGPIAELYAQPANPELMGFLGPGNWLTPEEARRWLGLEIAEPRCFRPEQISIAPAAEGGAVLEHARFRGSFAEAVLRAPGGSEARPFFHRPAGPLEAPGGRVTVRLA